MVAPNLSIYGLEIEAMCLIYHDIVNKNSEGSEIVAAIDYTAWKVSVFGVILVRIFPHSDWIRRDTV